jgi:hypothetical protein
MARRRRYSPTSSPRKMWERVVKKTALRPKAARGKAVAVPRCRGQFRAAWLLSVASFPVVYNLQVLIAAWKAEQLPKPVRNEKKQSANTLIDPTPPSYATLIG